VQNYKSISQSKHTHELHMKYMDAQIVRASYIKLLVVNKTI